MLRWVNAHRALDRKNQSKSAASRRAILFYSLRLLQRRLTRDNNVQEAERKHPTPAASPVLRAQQASVFRDLKPLLPKLHRERSRHAWLTTNRHAFFPTCHH